MFIVHKTIDKETGQREVTLHFNPDARQDCLYLTLVLERIQEAQKTLEVVDKNVNDLYTEMMCNYVTLLKKQ